MTFPTAFTSTETNKTRAKYSGTPFLLMSPNTIILQVEVPALSGKYAEVGYTTTVTGDYNDVKPDMVFTITSSTSDFNNPLVRGYVREDGATTELVYINEQDITVPSGYYLTVFEDFDLFPRKGRWDGTTTLLDYDITFEDLPATIGDIDTCIVLNTSGASATQAFAPTVTAMGKSATISTYAWDVGDGTITVGTSASKDITVSFPTGHRWIHLTVTDSNGVISRLHIEVYCDYIPNSSYNFDGIESISWTNNKGGWSGSCTAYDGISSLVDNQRLVLYIDDYYNGTQEHLFTGVALVGRVRRDNESIDQDDEANKQLSNDFEIEGYAQTLENISCPGFSAIHAATPATWNEMVNPSPVKVIHHLLQRYTTAGSIIPFNFESGDLNYNSGTIAVSGQGVIGSINEVLRRTNSSLEFSAPGQARIKRITNFIATASRAGSAVNVMNFIEDDILDFQVNYNYLPTVGQVKAGGSYYDLTSRDYVFLIGKAPSVTDTSGEEVDFLNSQILDSSDTLANGYVEIARRAASALAIKQQETTATVALFDSYRELVSSQSDRYTFTLDSTYSLTGKAFTSSDFWQLEALSFRADVVAATIDIQGSFRLETDGGASGRIVTVVPETSGDWEFPVYPVLQPYDGLFNVDGYLFSPDDTGDYAWEVGPDAYNPDKPLDPNSQEPLPEPGCGNYAVYFADPTGKTTSFNSVVSETYTIYVQGDARTGALPTTGKSVDFATPADYTVPIVTPDTTLNLYSNNDSSLDGTVGNALPSIKGGAIYDTGGGGSSRYRKGAFVHIDLDSPSTVTQVSIDGLRGSGTLTNVLAYQAHLYNSSDTLVGWLYTTTTVTNGVWKVVNLTSSHLLLGVMTGVSYIHASIANSSGSTFTNDYWLDNVIISVAGGGDVRSDAFYYNYNNGTATEHGTGDGLLVDGSNLATIPAYNSGHVYKAEVTGTGSPFTFKFGDTVSYADNDWLKLKIKVCGPGAKS